MLNVMIAAALAATAAAGAPGNGEQPPAQMRAVCMPAQERVEEMMRRMEETQGRAGHDLDEIVRDLPPPCFPNADQGRAERR